MRPWSSENHKTFYCNYHFFGVRYLAAGEFFSSLAVAQSCIDSTDVNWFSHSILAISSIDHSNLKQLKWLVDSQTLYQYDDTIALTYFINLSSGRSTHLEKLCLLFVSGALVTVRAMRRLSRSDEIMWSERIAWLTRRCQRVKQWETRLPHHEHRWWEIVLELIN